MINSMFHQKKPTFNLNSYIVTFLLSAQKTENWRKTKVALNAYMVLLLGKEYITFHTPQDRINPKY